MAWNDDALPALTCRAGGPENIDPPAREAHTPPIPRGDVKPAMPNEVLRDDRNPDEVGGSPARGLTL
jgi:hypothetical protein